MPTAKLRNMRCQNVQSVSLVSTPQLLLTPRSSHAPLLFSVVDIYFTSSVLSRWNDIVSNKLTFALSVAHLTSSNCTMFEIMNRLLSLMRNATQHFISSLRQCLSLQWKHWFNNSITIVTTHAVPMLIL